MSIAGVDQSGREWHIPGERASLVATVRDACEACVATLALLEAAAAAFGDNADVVAISHSAIESSAPVIVSAEDAGPGVTLYNKDGEVLAHHLGFDRDAWQAIYQRLISLTYSPPPVVDWASYPSSGSYCRPA